MQNLAPAATGGEHAAAFCSRESTRNAVFLYLRDAEFFIGNGGIRTGIDTGIIFPGRFGLKGSTGALAVPHYGKYRELIRGSFGEPVHFHVAVGGRAFFYGGGALREHIAELYAALHIPLECEGRFGGFVVQHLESGGLLGRYGGRRFTSAAGLLRIGLVATGNGHQGQGYTKNAMLHSFSYSSAAQMRGPMPLGSFARTRSLI